MPGPPHERGHGPDHGPPPGGPPGGQVLINDERLRDVVQIGTFLESVGSELKNNGATEMGGQMIRPSSTPSFSVQYERMPRGELKLHFEIEWDPNGTAVPRAASSDLVGEKTSTRTDRSPERSDETEDATPE